MEESTASTEIDEASASESMEPIQLAIDGRSMGLYEIQRTIELVTGSKSSNSAKRESDKRSGGNSLSLTGVGLSTSLTEDLIRLIRQTKNWDSISLTNSTGDRTLCNDLLFACTAHPSICSLAWRARIADAIHAGTTRILEPTDFSTVHALLYGLKYGSHLTKLEATGLVLDVNMANLLSRALVRNTTVIDLTLNGTRFLSESSSNENGNTNENHRGTKNTTVQTLSFGLRFNRTIESLSLDMCNDLEDEDIACLINAVNSDGTVLRRLSLQETACFDQGMSSVAMLLQENVIEELNLSYLVRRRRNMPEQDQNQEESQDNQQEEEEKAHQETVETNTDEEEKDGGEAKPAPDTESIDRDQGDEQMQEETLQENDQDVNDNKKEQEHQQVRNTSLKVLSMAGNFLDDEYLESLLRIFPSQTNQYVSNKEESCCSCLEELNLLGNRFSKYGIQELLKKLPRFPYLQRLYLGYQRAPPLHGPTALSQAMLSRMMASNFSLSDRNAQFTPGSLRNEFVAAVSENPSNFRLTDVNIMALSDEDKDLDGILKYHMKLNIGGRKLLASYVKSNVTAVATENATTLSRVPLGIWPLVLDRANRLYPLPSMNDGKNAALVAAGERKQLSSDRDGFHAGDVIFCLLHGPMIFENLDRRSLKD